MEHPGTHFTGATLRSCFLPSIKDEATSESRLEGQDGDRSDNLIADRDSHYLGDF